MSVVTVEIGGQRYPIRSGLDERYIAELAAYVDQKMRAAVNAAPESDMLGLAILAPAVLISLILIRRQTLVASQLRAP